MTENRRALDNLKQMISANKNKTRSYMNYFENNEFNPQLLDPVKTAIGEYKIEMIMRPDYSKFN
mgnify:FL=1